LPDEPVSDAAEPQAEGTPAGRSFET
jgi:hypothetical protein